MNELETDRLLIPYDEVRGALGGIGRTTMHDLVNHNQLTRVRIGRRAFITAESLRAYVGRITEAASA